MADNPISQNSTAKRVSKYKVSAERAEQFKKDFAPEFILTIPGLSGPVVKPHKNVDGEEK